MKFSLTIELLIIIGTKHGSLLAVLVLFVKSVQEKKLPAQLGEDLLPRKIRRQRQSLQGLEYLLVVLQVLLNRFKNDVLILLNYILGVFERELGPQLSQTRRQLLLQDVEHKLALQLLLNLRPHRNRDRLQNVEHVEQLFNAELALLTYLRAL